MSYYLAFTDSFIENYCINKDKPELNCDGKCELSKLLDRNSTESENQEKMMLLTSSELVFYLNYSDFKPLLNIEGISYQKTSFIPQLYSFDFFERLIKPPKNLT